MQEVKQEEIYYVWSSTERIGQIVQVDHNNIDPEWINFTDSTRINPSLINEFLLPANSLQSANQISKDLGGLGSSLVNTKESPVTPAVIEATPKAVAIAAPPVEEVNVMMEMLKKMSKKNKAEMPVLINIPSNSVYEMLKEQMDLEEADLNEQIGLLVENQINNLQEQLREQITIFITKYYTNVATREKNPK
mgnify:CR=1 FL=1|jgi:hypothetical protein|tara:strand:- start:9896 stop:10471 length:576 start_codon:yes stop_codon:yes gene_type:complete